MMKKIKLVINAIPPTINDWENMNKWDRRRNKADWENVVIQTVNVAHCRPAKPFEKTIIFYRFYFASPNRRDVTNLYGAVKVLEDGLVKANMIKDDSSKFTIPIAIPMGMDRKNPRVEIEIWEVESLDVDWTTLVTSGVIA